MEISVFGNSLESTITLLVLLVIMSSLFLLRISFFSSFLNLVFFLFVSAQIWISLQYPVSIFYFIFYWKLVVKLFLYYILWSTHKCFQVLFLGYFGCTFTDRLSNEISFHRIHHLCHSLLAESNIITLYECFHLPRLCPNPYLQNLILQVDAVYLGSRVLPASVPTKSNTGLLLPFSFMSYA